MTLHELERSAGKITVRVLEEGKIINDKYYPEGWVEVVSGITGETYAFPPSVALANYKVDKKGDFYKNLLKANGGKLP